MNRIVLLFIISLLSVASFGQYDVTVYNKEKGLMSDNVQGVWQDDEGYIWIADEVGFNRVNGDEIINYWPEEGKVVGYGKQILSQNNRFTVVDYEKNKKVEFKDKKYTRIDIKNSAGFSQNIQNRILFMNENDTLYENFLNDNFSFRSLDKNELCNNDGEILLMNGLDSLFSSEFGFSTNQHFPMRMEEMTDYFKEKYLNNSNWFFMKQSFSCYYNTDKAYFKIPNGDFVSVNKKLHRNKLKLGKYLISNIIELKKNVYLIRAFNHSNLILVNGSGELLKTLQIEDGLGYYQFTKFSKNEILVSNVRKNTHKIISFNSVNDFEINKNQRLSGVTDSKRGFICHLKGKDNSQLKIITRNKTFTIDMNVKMKYLYQAFEDKEGNLWLRFSNGLVKLTLKNEELSVVPDFKSWHSNSSRKRFQLKNGTEVYSQSKNQDTSFVFIKKRKRWEKHIVLGSISIYYDSCKEKLKYKLTNKASVTIGTINISQFKLEKIKDLNGSYYPYKKPWLSEKFIVMDRNCTTDTLYGLRNNERFIPSNEDMFVSKSFGVNQDSIFRLQTKSNVFIGIQWTKYLKKLIVKDDYYSFDMIDDEISFAKFIRIDMIFDTSSLENSYLPPLSLFI